MSGIAASGMVRGRSAGQRVLRVVLLGILLAFCFYYLMPLVVMISTSLKSLAEIRTSSLIALPREPSLDAWFKAWDGACVGVRCNGLRPYMLNSALMVVPAVAISTFLGAINGYALTKWRFAGADTILH